MAINKWIGGVDGAGAANSTLASVAANWSLVNVPIDTDTLIFDADADDDSSTGKKYDCDWTGFAGGANAYADMFVTPDYDGDIALSGSYFECNLTDTGKLVYEGAGICYIKLTAATGTNAAVGVYVNCTGTLYLDSNANVNTWGDIFVIGGTMYLDDGCRLQELTVLGASAVVVGGLLIWDSTGAAAPAIRQLAGTITWDSELDVMCDVSGGTFNWGSTSNEGAYGSIDLTLVELKVYNGGIFNWNMVPTSGKTSFIEQFFIYNGGKLDASIAGTAGTKVIGKTAATALVSEVWFGGTVILNGATDLTTGSGDSILNYGGVLTLPDNTSITLP